MVIRGITHCSVYRTMRRQDWLSFIAVCYVLAFWTAVAMFFFSDDLQTIRGIRHLLQEGTTRSVSVSHAMESDKPATARRNILVVAHSRSGTTFTGDIFNHHPDVFYMYEPLLTVKRALWRKNKNNFPKLATEFLKRILQ